MIPSAIAKVTKQVNLPHCIAWPEPDPLTNLPRAYRISFALPWPIFLDDGVFQGFGLDWADGQPGLVFVAASRVRISCVLRSHLGSLSIIFSTKCATAVGDDLQEAGL